MTTDETIGALQTALENAQDEIKRLTEQVEALQRIAAELNSQNVGLKQQITRLESGHKQTVYPWKAE